MVPYELLGRIFIVCVLASLALTGTALLFGLYSIRKKRILFPTLVLFFLDLFYVPSRWLLRTFSMDEELVDQIIVEVSNSVMRKQFAKAKKPIVVFPQCLRHPDCKAPCDPEVGYKCLRCGKCVLGELTVAAKKHGIMAFIVPGDRFVKKIIRKVRPDAALGVACKNELSSSMRSVSKLIPCQGVLLLKDGCYMTDVDPKAVEEKMGVFE